MKSSKSLKFKLMSLTMGITFVVGGGALVVLTRLASVQRNNIDESFESQARSVTDAIAAQFYERYGDVQAFALNPTLQSADRHAIESTLNAYSEMYGVYDLIMVLDAKGHVMGATTKSPTGKDLDVHSVYSGIYADAPWFKAAMNGQFTADKTKSIDGTFVEDFQLDSIVSQVYGHSRLGNSFSAPIKDSKGMVVGVVTNRANSRWFEQAMKDTREAMRQMGEPTAEVTLLNKDGFIVFEDAPSTDGKKDQARYDFEVLLKKNLAESPAFKLAREGKSGTVEVFHSRAKANMIVGYSPIDGPKMVDALGWTAIVREESAIALAELASAKFAFYSSFGVIFLLGTCASFFYSTQLSRRLDTLAMRLSEGSTELSSAATSIASSSTELSEAAVEQASAIQETAASIDEVSAMVKKSSENATQSTEASRTSREAAENGKRAVEDMLHAIQDISKGNAEIMAQVEESNREMGEIVKVIAEIGTKTKVINDIVFQTKLLSFNASVEAARAGEHGKGFAVVAEEVGNLAQMSGNAAKEISGMLDSSIKKVEGIASSTKVKVERLIQDSRAKVDGGTQIAGKCSEALHGILESVQQVETMVAEIASASSEQSQGIGEINKAMNQLDQVTQQNTAVSQQASTSAEQLSSQAADLTGLVSELKQLVHGTGGKPESAAATTAPFKATATKAEGKVISMSDVRASKAKRVSTPAPETAETAEPVKAVVNGAVVPSKDDPRFRDV